MDQKGKQKFKLRRLIIYRVCCRDCYCQVKIAIPWCPNHVTGNTTKIILLKEYSFSSADFTEPWRPQGKI